MKELKIGDLVVRNMCGVKMSLKISNIDNKFIYCGPRKFDKFTGAEVDEELGWDNFLTGSFLENFGAGQE